MTNAAIILRRSFEQGQDWTKDDALDAILWVRVLLALLTGVTCGMMGAEGLYVFLGFLGLTYTAGRVWLTYHDISEETYGGSTEKPEGPPLHFEGFPQSVSLFVLCWVVSYALSRP